MIPIVLIIISLILDGVLTNYLPYLVNDLSYLTPLFTLISIFIIYPFYHKNIKKYLLIVFIIGFIYDLFYTNLLFFNAVIFLLIGLISMFIQKNLESGPIKLIFYTIIIISIYELTQGMILYVYNLFPITLSKIIYKITHSLIINIIYTELVYFIIKYLPKKYRKISIN